METDAEDCEDVSFADLVRRGRFRGTPSEMIVAQVARAMYALGLTRGAGESDIGVFGPRLYMREARAFVDAELERLSQ